MIGKSFSAFLNPENYHGWNRARRFFEGWYFKAVDLGGQHPFAVIPGIAMDETGKRQAFIQVLDGAAHSAVYHKFEFDAFKADPRRFSIEIAGSSFSQDRIALDLPGLKGELRFKENFLWPKHLLSPGIMGPFAFVPRMECCHAIVSMDNRIEGSLDAAGGIMDFTGGRGYIEKDWGGSFPKAYVWMQTNHFSAPGISFNASVAEIPWMRGRFTGFIAAVLVDGRLIRFTTYNGTKLQVLHVIPGTINIEMQNNRYSLEVAAYRNDVASLASPIRGFMDGRIEESMTSSVRVRIYDRKNRCTVLDDTGHNAGLEAAGALDRIVTP